MKTYRYRGHSRTDPAAYRVPGELERWQQRDPLVLFGALLARDGVLAADAQSAIRAEMQILVDDAAARAAEAPFPTLEETRVYVYAN
jgi:pyruvate dehydrogenase E1 component alpha subunit